jgi:RNA polymerase sigma-54 factor
MQEQTLNLTLSHRLTLTPQLKQSIEMLALGHEDLNNLIQSQTESNPFLELSKPSVFTSNYGNNSVNTKYVDEEQEDIFNLTAAQVNYRDDLHEQLYIKKLDNRTLALIQYLIENLDDNGYLAESLDELITALPQQAKITLNEFEQALFILQDLEPIGIGSRDTKEYLCIQLKHLALKTTNKNTKNNYLLAYHICNEYFNLFSKNQIQKIAQSLNIDIQEINQAIGLIKKLKVYPIQESGEGDSIYHITPDFFVFQNELEEWNIQLNQDLMPKLSINNIYAQSINSLTTDNANYVKQKLQEASWLIKSIQQRFDTLFKVASMIIQEQQAFFSHGNMAMRPLIMQSIADDLHMHVSTISRAIKNKYLQCPAGIYPLNYFFNSCVSTDVGGYVSSKTITECIRNMVEEENKLLPLSDDEMCKQLQQQGMIIARRTIAKYRQELGILSSTKRKCVLA